LAKLREQLAKTEEEKASLFPYCSVYETTNLPLPHLRPLSRSRSLIWRLTPFKSLSISRETRDLVHAIINQ
jgi:hypothetical protein